MFNPYLGKCLKICSMKGPFANLAFGYFFFPSCFPNVFPSTFLVIFHNFIQISITFPRIFPRIYHGSRPRPGGWSPAGRSRHWSWRRAVLGGQRWDSWAPGVMDSDGWRYLQNSMDMDDVDYGYRCFTLCYIHVEISSGKHLLDTMWIWNHLWTWCEVRCDFDIYHIQ